MADVQVTVNLWDEKVAALQKIADATSTTLDAIIEDAVTDYLDAQRSPETPGKDT